ncbi:hypothetical protein AVEN_233117-1 [Araneus ventricosus]|uniref:Uncharacterized protein n=1 Tax=Araneus ventricosus TaxID=182803 RepID=A0A4Y2MUY7_ARAVE|nr:hypothetical protein AVEN_233117-1 [Araneus ventricosus]
MPDPNHSGSRARLSSPDSSSASVIIAEAVEEITIKKRSGAQEREKKEGLTKWCFMTDDYLKESAQVPVDTNCGDGVVVLWELINSGRLVIPSTCHLMGGLRTVAATA